MENYRISSKPLSTTQFQRNHHNMVQLDDEEREILRKLGDNSRRDQSSVRPTTTRRPNNNITRLEKVSEDKILRLPKLSIEERELLHKLGEHSGRDQSVRPTTTKRPNNNNINTLEKVSEEKILEVPKNKDNIKLETKKSIDIDQSAENFIQKFKQQLVLQRLESIEKYDKMLARGL